MYITSIIKIAVVCLVFFVATSEVSALSCADRKGVVSKLSEKYKEDKKWVGMKDDEHVIELWASNETGTWTILVSDVKHKTCIVASGQNWIDLESFNYLGFEIPPQKPRVRLQGDTQNNGAEHLRQSQPSRREDDTIRIRINTNGPRA